MPGSRFLQRSVAVSGSLYGYGMVMSGFMGGSRGSSEGESPPTVKRTVEAAHRPGLRIPERRCFYPLVPGQVSTRFLRFLRGDYWHGNHPSRTPGLCPSQVRPDGSDCNVATGYLTDSRRKTVISSGTITAFLGNIASARMGGEAKPVQRGSYRGRFLSGWEGVGEGG